MPHQSCQNSGSHVEPVVEGCDVSRCRFCQRDLRRQSVKSNIIQTALCDGLDLCNVLKRRFFQRRFLQRNFNFNLNFKEGWPQGEEKTLKDLEVEHQCLKLFTNSVKR